MLAQLLVLTVVAFVAPQIVPGVKVKGIEAAALIALLFVVFNVLIGWILDGALTLVALPFVILTLGLFKLLITVVVNAILLRLTDSLMTGFDLDGWRPAFGMGLLFGLGGWLARWLT